MAAAKALNEIAGGILDAAYKLHRGRRAWSAGISLRDGTGARSSAARFPGGTAEADCVLCDGMHVVDGLRVDLLVERLVVIEIKSVGRLLPVHPEQVLQRVVNGLDRSASPRESIRRRRLATPT